jgi:hypothetical protein
MRLSAARSAWSAGRGGRRATSTFPGGDSFRVRRLSLQSLHYSVLTPHWVVHLMLLTAPPRAALPRRAAERGERGTGGREVNRRREGFRPEKSVLGPPVRDVVNCVHLPLLIQIAKPSARTPSSEAKRNMSPTGQKRRMVQTSPEFAQWASAAARPVVLSPSCEVRRCRVPPIFGYKPPRKPLCPRGYRPSHARPPTRFGSGLLKASNRVGRRRPNSAARY